MPRSRLGHGGETGPHKDGWGIAYCEDDDVRVIREPAATSESDWLRFVEAHHLRSRIMVSHIRKATIGKRQLNNTQPFSRELGGRMHVFAQNGHLPGVQRSFALGMHRPIGSTDSEYAFCALLARLQQLWLSSDEISLVNQRLEVVATVAAELRALGLANFIYGDGATLFAHGHKRPHSPIDIRPPDLCMLRRHCSSEEPSLAATGVTVTLDDQDVVLLASLPLTDEPWAPLDEGEVVAVKDTGSSRTRRLEAHYIHRGARTAVIGQDRAIAFGLILGLIVAQATEAVLTTSDERLFAEAAPAHFPHCPLCEFL